MAAPTHPPQSAGHPLRGVYRPARSRPGSALVLCAALSTLALGSFEGRLLAQLAADVQADTAPPLFARTDAMLAGTLLSSLLLIDPAERLDLNLSAIASRDADSSVGIYRIGEGLGRGRVALTLAAAPLVWGLAVGDPKARRLGLHTFESIFVTSFLTRWLKEGVGRARPSCGGESDAFQPFSSDACHHSFPSGHTARAFAIATTFSLELGEASPWVPWASYTLATWTAVTRVRDRAHWPTDVLGGAALGILTARLVHRLNYPDGRDQPLLLAISVAPDGGMAIRGRLAVR